MVDALYAKLNSRGKKQFKVPSSRQSFSQHFAEYANLGLPAHKAALDGNVECLKECFCCYMKEGVPSRDINGATPLHLAAKSNRADTVKWLIRFTDLTAAVTAKHGETPAHVAAAQGHVESLKHMLTADGKEDIKSKLCTVVDNSGFSVLHLAIVKHRNECAKLLISELGPKAVSSLNESGVTAAHIASSAGNVEVLQFLNIKHKKLLHQEDKEGASPTYYAAQEGRLEVLKFMSEKCKCDLSSACSDGLKPIHAASQCGHTNIVRYIVSQTGNQSIFDTTPDGATPLHFATSTGQESTAQWLMNSDASGMLVTSKDKNGDTPAHDAAESGHVPMLKVLLENGADLYAINNDGNTPYSLALSGGNMEVANFVMTYASKSPQKDSGGPVRIYSMQGDVDVVEVNKSELSGTPPQPERQTSKTSLKKQNSKTSLKKGQNSKTSLKAEEPSSPDQPPEPLSPSKSSKKKTSLSSFKTSQESTKKEKEAAKKEKEAAKKEKESAKKEKESAKKEAKKGKENGKDKKDQKKSKKEEKAKKGPQKSNSFMGNAAQTLKSFDTNVSASEEGDLQLHMTEDELSMFSDTKPLVNSNSEDDNIVVRYSAPEATNPMMLDDQPADPGYSTISELEVIKEKKEKKMGRKVAKSIQKAIKPGSDKQTVQSSQDIGGGEMGFKPQFRTNPLMKLGGAIPPTPPPTPATAASVATSDDTPQHNLEDVEEIDNDGGFAPYAVPDPEVVKMKAKQRELEEQNILKTSENQKLLKDALQDLGGDDSPPEIPKQKFTTEEYQAMPSRVSNNLEGSKTSMDSKKARLSATKASPELNQVKLKPVSSKPTASEEQDIKSRFPVLKSTKRDIAPLEKPKTELSKIKLKKANDWKRAEFSHPETETTSGASDELKHILKKKVVEAV